MDRKHNITLRLGDGHVLQINSVSPAEEELIRKAERSVNDLWKEWLKSFPNKSPDEVMTLVAFRFAEFFYRATSATEELEEELERVEMQLDKLLGEVSSLE